MSLLLIHGTAKRSLEMKTVMRFTKGKEKNSPERKAQCTDFVAATVKKTAEIILRELEA